MDIQEKYLICLSKCAMCRKPIVNSKRLKIQNNAPKFCIECSDECDVNGIKIIKIVKYCLSLLNVINKKLDAEPESKIPFQLKYTDIIKQYILQNFSCAKTGKIMTFSRANLENILLKYPNNMVIQLKVPAFGYVEDNFILVCAQHLNKLFSPAYIIPEDGKTNMHQVKLPGRKKRPYNELMMHFRIKKSRHQIK